MRSTDRPASLARRALPAAALAGLSGLVLTQLDRPDATNAATDTGSNGVVNNGVIANTTTSSPPATNGTDNATAETTIPNSTVPATPTCSGTSYTGPSADTRWGPVQVTAVVAADGTICSADATSPHDRNRSSFINDRAVPIINEAVTTQGINFDTVSGATYTSDGYRASLQAILDGI